MLDLNSPEVQQQIKDGILDVDKIEYALCWTGVDRAVYGDNNCHTRIVSRRWYEKPTTPKADRTSHLNCDKALIQRFRDRLIANEYKDTIGSNGTKLSADWHRNREQEIVEELVHPQRRWFVVYHDDKYLYDYETGVPINVEQPDWVLTNLTIFND